MYFLNLILKITLKWKEFLDLGELISDDELENRIKSLAPNKCCTLIYTSGTTGNHPKVRFISVYLLRFKFIYLFFKGSYVES